VRFQEEKSLLGVNGGEYKGKVVDNEWKGLSKGLEKRKGERGEGA
jgi:hypothetical protein